MNDKLLNDINQYINTPKPNEFVKTMENAMDSLTQMDTMLGHIDDERKRNVMKRNVTMAQSLLIDNMEMFNELANKDTE